MTYLVLRILTAMALLGIWIAMPAEAQVRVRDTCVRAIELQGTALDEDDDPAFTYILDQRVFKPSLSGIVFYLDIVTITGTTPTAQLNVYWRLGDGTYTSGTDTVAQGASNATVLAEAVVVSGAAGFADFAAADLVTVQDTLLGVRGKAQVLIGGTGVSTTFTVDICPVYGATS